MTMWRPPNDSSAALFLAPPLLPFGLHLAQIVVEAIEALLPKAAIVREPVVDVLQPVRLDPARAPLRFAAARDQAGALQHLEVLGDGGQADVEGLGELGDRGLAEREAGQDRPAGRIGERREGRAERVR